MNECSKKGCGTSSPHPGSRGKPKGWVGRKPRHMCVHCSSVVVVLIGIVGLGDLRGHLAGTVPESPDLHIER